MSTSMDEPRVPQSYCWIPTVDLVPGEVVARPVYGRSGQQLSIHLAEGSPISASTIGQLINKGVECVAVVRVIPEGDEAYAASVARYEARLHEIFGSHPDENCAPLLAALLEEGPGTC